MTSKTISCKVDRTDVVLITRIMAQFECGQSDVIRAAVRAFQPSAIKIEEVRKGRGLQQMSKRRRKQISQMGVAARYPSHAQN
jgi:hypothetical protein